MMANKQKSFSIPQPLTREVYLRLIRAATSVNQHRFAREAALEWLANFPGDLTVSLEYAKALLGEGQIQLAVRILQGLCNADPEFFDAANALFYVYDQARKDKLALDDLLVNGDMSYLYALLGKTPYQTSIAVWGKELRLARLAVEKGELDVAEEITKRVIKSDPPSALAAVIHLDLIAKNGIQTSSDDRQLAIYYLHKWPDCLACKLYLADWLMDGSDSGQAVALLHQAASRDVSGQVASRLWGDRNPYRSLWPEKLELALEIPIPADVAAVLGWNQLPANTAANRPMHAIEAVGIEDGLVVTPERSSAEQWLDKNTDRELEKSEFPVKEGVNPEQLGKFDIAVDPLISYESSEESDAEAVAESDETCVQPANSSQRDESLCQESLLEIQDELDRIAGKLKARGKGLVDGRYPVYIVFSLKQQLEKKFGSKVADILVAEMRRVVQAVDSQRGWSSKLFLPDDPEGIDNFGIQVHKLDDPWALKLAIADLDRKLAESGEMIGALLIVGGPEIIPFHHLPNPVDDQDLDVPSDNPYATRDNNYFVSEWPVGRLPCGAEMDAKFLIGALRRISLHHSDQSRSVPWFFRWIYAIGGLFSRKSYNRKHSFGYTAAIWKDAASKVFRIIGEPKKMHASPPAGIVDPKNEDPLDDLDFEKKVRGRVPTPDGYLGYFNLHGLVDAPEWFGQRHPQDKNDGPDYPVAFRPQDIVFGKRGKSSVPKVVFSEACFGSHIQGRDIQDSIALKFLEAGSLVVVGSTCMAYGSVDEGLIAADLLGYNLWRFIKEGTSAGEALKQAKIQLASEMHQRQGYLDGEDQKTIISFVYYGDPLAQPIGRKSTQKSVVRSKIPEAPVKIVCDRIVDTPISQVVPKEVMTTVRQIVGQYLPGMTGARVAYSQEREHCTGDGHLCPTSQFHAEIKPDHKSVSDHNSFKLDDTSSVKSRRRLVTLSKQVLSSKGMHPYYARLTLTEKGELVKMAVSR